MPRTRSSDLRRQHLACAAPAPPGCSFFVPLGPPHAAIECRTRDESTLIVHRALCTGPSTRTYTHGLSLCTAVSPREFLIVPRVRPLPPPSQALRLNPDLSECLRDALTVQYDAVCAVSTTHGDRSTGRDIATRSSPHPTKLKYSISKLNLKHATVRAACDTCGATAPPQRHRPGSAQERG